MTARKLTPLQRAIVVGAVKHPGLSITELGKVIGVADPWSGGHHTRVRSLECYEWLTITKDYGQPYAPCLVWPTAAARALVDEQAAA